MFSQLFVLALKTESSVRLALISDRSSDGHCQQLDWMTKTEEVMSSEGRGERWAGISKRFTVENDSRMLKGELKSNLRTYELILEFLAFHLLIFGVLNG